ncbi:hypothetical protein [Sphingomonas sp. R86521]|uniref:hypothetical protein n=1 Tax=Sphingomonas sp. R86521 TaxID=3093860 RepID=UPI0036D2BC1B
MIPTLALLVAGALIGQTVEQIQPTRSPPPGHAHGVASDTTQVAQVPPQAVAVDQPVLIEATGHKPDTTVDVARAYATLLANGSAARANTPDLGARTVAEVAAAAGLVAAPQPAAKPTPPAAPTP